MPAKVLTAMHRHSSSLLHYLLLVPLPRLSMSGFSEPNPSDYQCLPLLTAIMVVVLVMLTDGESFTSRSSCLSTWLSPAQSLRRGTW